MPVLPKTGLLFLMISGQDCLDPGSQSSKACPSTSTASCGYQQGFIVFSNHSPNDGLVCLFSKLTLPVTALFNKDFLLTVWEDWQIYYNGLSITIFIGVQFSVTDCLFHLLTWWIVLAAITLIRLNVIHECTLKSTLPLESIRGSESTTVLVTTHSMPFRRINRGSRNALEEVGKGEPKLLARATLGGRTTTSVLPQTTCRHFEPPALQTTAGLNHLPWWWSAEVGQMKWKGRTCQRKKVEKASLNTEKVLHCPEESGCYFPFLMDTHQS